MFKTNGGKATTTCTLLIRLKLLDHVDCEQCRRKISYNKRDGAHKRFLYHYTFAACNNFLIICVFLYSQKRKRKKTCLKKRERNDGFTTVSACVSAAIRVFR